MATLRALVLTGTDRIPQVSAPAGADGTISMVIDGPEGSDVWLVDRIVVATNSPKPTALRLYEGTEPRAGYLLDATIDGDNNVAEYPPNGLLVPTFRQLLFVWTGALPGSVANASVQYRAFTSLAAG